MPPKKGQRQARGLARQQQILDAAFDLFAANGYRSTTLAQVADAVGLTEAGVLHHFASKEALLRAVLDARGMIAPDVEAWIAEPGGGLESLRRFPALARVLVDDPRLARFDAVVGGESIAEGAVAFDHFRQRMRSIRRALTAMLRVGTERGEIDPDVDLDAVASEIVAFMSGIQTQWLLDRRRVDLEGAYRHYVAALEGRLRASR
ncbi:MAG: TetR/AcrR family transcriptional regulator [Acidimicrobiales bacterium]